MSDIHLRILRAAAASRARQLAADHAEPGEPAADAAARHVALERLTERARQQLLTAARRRRKASEQPPGGTHA